MPVGLLIVLAVVLGIAIWVVLARRNPTPLPYSQRFMLIPLPNLSPERLRDLLEPKAGERLLEVGPGLGNHALELARAVRPTGTVEVVDVQQEMLDHTTGRARRRELENVKPTLADARELPFPDSSMDGAFLVTTLGEVPDQPRALSELARVLKPGGRLVVGESPLDPHYVSPRALLRRAEAAGLRLDTRRGSAALGYLARLVKPV